MAKKQKDPVEQKLDNILELLQYLVALELYRLGVPKTEIAKHLHTATATVVKMLKDVKKKE